ncbi:hypothetical protein [Thiomonas sp.]
MNSAVPAIYQGLWRRRLLTTPILHDDTTLVFWLQTASWHADLRIPADRPDFSGCVTLSDCSRAQLLALLGQEGFAGVTLIDGDTCEWQRCVDYRPTGLRDLGRMVFSSTADTIEEYGVEAEYTERWERVAEGEGSVDVCWSTAARAQILWLRAGRRFMRVRDRPLAEAGSRKYWYRLHEGTASDDDLRRLADCEISFGEIAGQAGCILHSTLPWLEGQRLTLPIEMLAPQTCSERK